MFPPKNSRGFPPGYTKGNSERRGYGETGARRQHHGVRAAVVGVEDTYTQSSDGTTRLAQHCCIAWVLLPQWAGGLYCHLFLRHQVYSTRVSGSEPHSKSIVRNKMLRQINKLYRARRV